MTQPDRQENVVLYQTDDGHSRIEVRLDGDTVWLTQAAIADPYQAAPQNITQHVATIYDEGRLEEAATCKPFLQVRAEGARQVKRHLRHYGPPMILAVGHRKAACFEP